MFCGVWARAGDSGRAQASRSSARPQRKAVRSNGFFILFVCVCMFYLKGFGLKISSGGEGGNGADASERERARGLIRFAGAAQTGQGDGFIVNADKTAAGRRKRNEVIGVGR